MEGPDGASSTRTPETTDGNGTSPAPAPATEPAGSTDGQPAPPAKRKLKRSTRIGLTVIIILALLAAIGFGGAYFLYSRNFVTTDNAQVDGDKVQINAPATGTLVDWRGGMGTQVHKDEVLGRIKIQAAFGQPQQTIKSPGNGTIAVDNGIEGSWYTAGQQLAAAYDLNNIYVTARVDETDISGVRVGAPVDIDVDAFSGVPVTGIVTEVQRAAAGQFSLFPEQNTSGNFQKVTQVIPVKIALTNTGGVALSPGMNVTVKIHKPGT
ncbi:MAG: efflux RND transporter periplasmic adaptor subunit [Pseudonocardia sp.]|nr:efflux RND transporter periplasmic adaptor subunit [Pseudonocardia sp.]MBO0876544.1 efflux RND transporter periplasmic adaptor subunit [Pseudonocardia sp.]